MQRSSRPAVRAVSAERGERIDPKTRRPLPEGIRFRKDRGKYQVRVWAIGLNGEQRERSTYVETLAEAYDAVVAIGAGRGAAGLDAGGRRPSDARLNGNTAGQIGRSAVQTAMRLASRTPDKS